MSSNVSELPKRIRFSFCCGAIRSRENQKQLAQNKFKLEDSKASLAIQQGILDKLKILSEEGGISQLQYLNQQQEVQTARRK